MLSEVREDQSIDFYKLHLMLIGSVVGEIWGEDSLWRWEWPLLTMKEWPHGLGMLIEARRDLYINFCQFYLESIGPGAVEIWGDNFLHWMGFGIWRRNGIL